MVGRVNDVSQVPELCIDATPYSFHVEVDDLGGSVARIRPRSAGVGAIQRQVRRAEVSVAHV